MDFDIDPEDAFRINQLSPKELTAEYLKWRQRYRKLVKEAQRVSMGSAGIYVEETHLFYAAILFTRIGVLAQSISILLADGPRSDRSAPAMRRMRKRQGQFRACFAAPSRDAMMTASH